MLAYNPFLKEGLQVLEFAWNDASDCKQMWLLKHLKMKTCVFLDDILALIYWCTIKVMSNLAFICYLLRYNDIIQHYLTHS